MQSQLFELGKRIEMLKPYFVNGMNELMIRRDILATQLRETDPDRFATVEEVIPIEVPEEYIEDIEMETVEMIPLSESEIAEKAKELFENQPLLNGGLVPHPTERQTMKINKLIPKSETKYHTFKTGIIFKDKHTIPYQTFTFEEKEEIIDIGPKYVQGDSPKLPIEFFINQLKNEMKPIKVKKVIPIKMVRITQGSKLIEVNHERHDFEHYRKLAVEQIKSEFLQKFQK